MEFIALLVLSIFSALFTTACGDRNELTKKQSQRVIEIKSSINPPAKHYFLSRESCPDDKTNQTLESAIIYSAKERETGLFHSNQPVEFGDLNLVATPHLTSDYIASVTYKSSYYRFCPNPYSSKQCFDDSGYIDWVNYNEGHPLVVCDTQSRFERESYEGIAMTSLYYLEKALVQYGRSIDLSIPPVLLEILPTYSSVYDIPDKITGEMVPTATYMTHNLAYFPGKNKIAVFPESEKYQPIYAQKGHLWESAFALAHEAAHHIEHLLTAHSMRQPALLWNPFLHQYKTAPFTPLQGQQASADTLTSLSEAFADLLAFYAIDEDSESITSLYGLGDNRNVKDRYFHFSDGQYEKRLDHQTLNKLFNIKEYDFQVSKKEFRIGPHEVGSIIAHILYEVIEILTSKAELYDAAAKHPVAKMRYVIKWHHETQLAIPQTPPSGHPFEHFLPVKEGIRQLVLDELARQNFDDSIAEEIKEAVCHLSKRTLPVFQQAIFEKSDGTCRNKSP